MIFLRWLAIVCFGLTAVARAEDVTSANDDTQALAKRIVLLANAREPSSLRVAHHYAEARGVPPENIIALPMSREETMTWREFVAEIWEPLTRELIARKWLDEPAENTTGERDEIGRARRVITGHRMVYLVVCRGVPLRIMNEPSLYRENLPSTSHPAYRTNQGAVDGELAALPLGNYPISGFVENPLFLKKQSPALATARVVKVARLDGPDEASALALVDNALAAEKRAAENPAWKGKAYVDYGGGVGQTGNQWLERTAKDFERAGYETIVEKTPATFAANAPFDDARFYFGWYAWNANGPFTHAGFRFPPGTVALHIHSFSAVTLRSARDGWCGPFIARGVTATFGNVFEPYLHLTHHTYAIAEALLRGERVGDAAFYALPALSWQEVFIGDPLYRPVALKK